MSKLMALVDEVKEKLTDQEYKVIVEEIAAEEKKKKFSRIRVMASVLKRNEDPDIEDPCCELEQGLFVFIVPTEYIIARHLTIGNVCLFRHLYQNCVTFDEDSAMEEFFNFNIGHIHVHNTHAIVVGIEPLQIVEVEDVY